MFAYEWDTTTGGVLLTSTQLKFSKEPRPVYYKELNILGFDKFWTYEKQDSLPYMWAEASTYIYRGRVVAKTIGGSLYAPPTIEVYEENLVLYPVDIDTMVAKNSEIMTALVNETIKNIYGTYLEYNNKIDVFYVAFSGGKDSVALLDIVQKALPHDEFIVVFGDTDMECEDTYRIREDIEKFPGYGDVKFYTAKSHLRALDTWDIFGPPSQTLRWCCSVHKTAPQILFLRKLLNKSNFRGMAFTGIRGDESVTRSKYETVSEGEKHDGQFTCNAIDNWNSAELFLFIYQNNLYINPSYKEGNSRVGCLVCPMAALKNEYMKNISSSNETQPFINKIISNSSKMLDDKKSQQEFLSCGGWKARRNGRELKNPIVNYFEQIDNGELILTVKEPKTNWKEWVKTIGVLSHISDDVYSIKFQTKMYYLSIKQEANSITAKIKADLARENPQFVKMLKIIFRKSAYCIQCKVCEVNCVFGYLIMSDTVKVNDACVKCQKCHKVDKGCLVYKSIVLPKGEVSMLRKQSLNSYSNHGVKKEWIHSYFELKNDFKTEHTLGSNMYDFFKRFLKDAQLMENEKFTSTAEIVENIGIDSPIAWGIILTNLSYAPQIGWYVKNIEFNATYSREAIIQMLDYEEVNETAAKQMLLAYKRILTETPLGIKIGLGKANTIQKGKTENMTSIIRTPWRDPDSLVILYSLYKFAEACDGYYQFTLSRVLNHEVESEGVSPTQIFGLDRETLVGLLNGLSINYPEFISVGFTHDLETINLRAEKTSMDVLYLF